MYIDVVCVCLPGLKRSVSPPSLSPPKRVAPENHQARPPDWGSKPGSGNQMTSHASSPLILLVITMYMCIWMCIWMCMAVYVMDGCNVCVSGKACIIYIYIYIYTYCFVLCIPTAGSLSQARMAQEGYWRERKQKDSHILNTDWTSCILCSTCSDQSDIDMRL